MARIPHVDDCVDSLLPPDVRNACVQYELLSPLAFILVASEYSEGLYQLCF